MTDELIERLRGGKCPRCNGWGEVAYFGQMVACECRGNYEAPISMATRTEAADTLASQARQMEALREAAKKALNFIENNEGEWGITLDCGDALRATLEETSRAD